MDGPSVKFLQNVQDHREVNEQPLLVGIGSCELHTIHGAFKDGVQSTDWILKEVLNSAYHIIMIFQPKGMINKQLLDHLCSFKLLHYSVNVFLESSFTNQRAFSHNFCHSTCLT